MDIHLHTVIYQILADLESSSLHCVIYARYFFFDQQMSFFEPVHIHKDLLREIDLSEDSLRCRMLLDACGAQDAYSIEIPFNYISKITRVCEGYHEGNQKILWKSASLNLGLFSESPHAPPFADQQPLGFSRD